MAVYERANAVANYYGVTLLSLFYDKTPSKYLLKEVHMLTWFFVRLLSIIIFVYSFNLYYNIEKVVMLKISQNTLNPIQGQLLLTVASLVITFGFIALYMPYLIPKFKNTQITFNLKNLLVYVIFGLFIDAMYMIYFNQYLGFLIGNKYYNILIHGNTHHIIGSLIIAFGIIISTGQDDKNSDQLD